MAPDGKHVVLLADDEVMIRNLVSSFLRKAGYHVLAAGNGQDAIRLAAEPGDIHLFLTDVDMPQVDGFSAYRQIRNARPDIKVLFMSGGGMFSELSLPQPLPFLQKPFGADALNRKITAILSEGHQTAGDWLKVVLVVDRDNERRDRTKRILNQNGYAVLTTTCAEDAEAVSDGIATIDLIISEVIFAGESGVQLAEHVKASNRAINTLLISHFDREILRGVSGFSTQPEFLPNFFTAEALMERVRKLVER